MTVRFLRADMLEPTVAAMWEAYSTHVLEPSGIRANGLQWIESRRIWYCAVQATINLQCQMADRCNGGHMSDDEAAHLMEGLDGECREFVMKIQANEPGF